MGIKIISTGRKLPMNTVTNDKLEEFLDTSDEWIASKTGIKSRFVCTSESLTDLAEGAARIALEKANLAPSDIDMLICATSTGDYLMPSLACCVLERIGAKCPAFDISAACTGFIYALDAADAYIRAGKASTILIIAADMMSRIVDWKDRNSCVLFSDGAGACVVARGEALKYIRTVADAQVGILCAQTGQGNSPFAVKTDENPRNGLLHMNGQSVYKFAIKAIESEIHSALCELDMSSDEVDYFILHQANARIVDSARVRLKVSPDKFPMNIQRCGNMSAASIPVLMDEMLEDNRIRPGNVIVLTGFGAGMTAGTAVMVWE